MVLGDTVSRYRCYQKRSLYNSFATTVTPTCHTTLSLCGASGIIVIGRGHEVTFKTRYEYWSVDGTDLSPGIWDRAGRATI